MSCSFDKEIIQKYIDNTIDPLELVVLKEHIAVCRDCKFELELMSKLESSLYEYFGNLSDNELPDQFSMDVLEQCYENSKALGYKEGLAKFWRINKLVAVNAVRYTNYLPGSKLAVNTAKQAGKGINKAVKGYVKNSFKRLIAGAIK